ncbi:ROK family protein [Kitasatospora sp. P5_F3]
MPERGQAFRRATHRALLLHLLRRYGPATRQMLARRSELSPTTVSSLVVELEERGLVTQRPVILGRAGRRPSLVSFNPAAGTALAVELGPRHLAVMVGSRTQLALAQRRVDLPPGLSRQAVAQAVLDCTEGVLADTSSGPELLTGVALAVGARTYAEESGQVADQWPAALVHLLRQRWRVPVEVVGSAALAALAEHAKGGAAGVHSLLCVTWTDRVELGVVLGGVLHRGPTGRAGSLGHVVVRPDGAVCRCGRLGCLDAYLRPPGGRPGEAPPPVPGGEGARLVVEAVTTAALLYDPSVVVLGGALAAPDDGLAAPLAAALRALPGGESQPVPVMCSTLGDRAVRLGGVHLVLSRQKAAVGTDCAPIR